MCLEFPPLCQHLHRGQQLTQTVTRFKGDERIYPAYLARKPRLPPPRPTPVPGTRIRPCGSTSRFPESERWRWSRFARGSRLRPARTGPTISPRSSRSTRWRRRSWRSERPLWHLGRFPVPVSLASAKVVLKYKWK